MKLRIATRNSRLALWQTHHVMNALQALYPQLTCEVIEMTTQGDINLSTSLANVGGKGLFLKELEHALLNQDADIAVHSLKDVPAEQTPGLALVTFLQREDPRDVLLSAKQHTLAQLPIGAVVGTSSVRRECQIKALRPDLRFKLLRGNVPTRIKKLENGEYDAIILANAGVRRLGYEARINHIFSPAESLPAVGQGVIVIQARSDDSDVLRLCAALDDTQARICVAAERAMHAYLNGSCQTPIAGLAQLIDHTLLVQGMVGEPDGSQIIRASVAGDPQHATQLGEQLAQQLLAQGADQILNAYKHLG